MAEFECQLCLFKSTRKNGYNAHLHSRKHINKTLEIKQSLKSQSGNELTENNVIPNITHPSPNAFQKMCKADMCLSSEDDTTIFSLKANECQYCYKEFCRKYSLLRHLRICPKKLEFDAAEKEKLKRELELIKFEQLLKEKDHEIEKKENEFLKGEISIKDQCSRTTLKTCNNALRLLL